MVQRLLRLLGRGSIIALTLTCAHAPLRAQTLAAAPVTHGMAQAPSSPRDPLLGKNLRTRFLIGLPETTEFAVFSLNNPNRVIVEVSEVKLRLPAQPKDKPIGLIKSFRAGQSAANRSRIIINVTEPVIVASAKIEKARDGHSQQLVVEIVPFGPPAAAAPAPTPPPVQSGGVTTASLGNGPSLRSLGKMVADALGGQEEGMPPPAFSLGAAGLQPPLPRPAVSPEVLAEKAFKPVIVIDPGHGGHDSGAIKNGAVEKNIVLAFGKKLAKKLKATGRFKVLMTRDEDVFVPLGERVAFAERHKANLFIAVHCDYADTGPRANGATIYSLRERTANRLRRSAKGDLRGKLLSKDEIKAVKQAKGNVNAVKAILADLAGREVDRTHDRTSAFARTVIENMETSTKMRQEPDKQAGFRVLKTAQFPSVLIELAYVTNKQDAKNLKSDAWRDKVTDSILTAVDNYFANQIAQLPL
jgi:N-acetylmuramoyl-L-alanine amidase